MPCARLLSILIPTPTPRYSNGGFVSFPVLTRGCCFVSRLPRVGTSVYPSVSAYQGTTLLGPSRPSKELVFSPVVRFFEHVMRVFSICTLLESCLFPSPL